MPWVRLGELAFRCQECDAEFAAAEARERLDRWQRVLAWCELAPVAE